MFFVFFGVCFRFLLFILFDCVGGVFRCFLSESSMVIIATLGASARGLRDAARCHITALLVAPKEDGRSILYTEMAATRSSRISRPRIFGPLPKEFVERMVMATI